LDPQKEQFGMLGDIACSFSGKEVKNVSPQSEGRAAIFDFESLQKQITFLQDP
jgi:hypothetical protein